MHVYTDVVSDSYLKGATEGLTVTVISYLTSVQNLIVLSVPNRLPSCLKNTPCLFLGSTIEKMTVNAGIFLLDYSHSSWYERDSTGAYIELAPPTFTRARRTQYVRTHVVRPVTLAQHVTHMHIGRLSRYASGCPYNTLALPKLITSSTFPLVWWWLAGLV